MRTTQGLSLKGAGGIEKHACGPACPACSSVRSHAVTAVGCVHVPSRCKHVPSMRCDLDITQAGFCGVFSMKCFCKLCITALPGVGNERINSFLNKKN